MSMDLKNSLDKLKEELTIDQIQMIIKVYERNKEVESRESDRQRKLAIETDFVKKDVTRNESTFMHCIRCNSLYIPLINSFFRCHICGTEVCSSCIRIYKSPIEMNLCKICFTERTANMKSGKWFNNTSERHSKSASLEVIELLSTIENDIKIRMESTKEANIPLNAISKGFANLFTNGDNWSSDSNSQAGTGRNSPSRDSYNSMSMDSALRLNLAANLKKKYQIKTPRYKEHFDDNKSDDLSINSTMTTSRTVFYVSDVSKNEHRTNGVNRGRDCQNFNRATNLRRSSNSASLASLDSCNIETVCCELVIRGEVIVMIDFAQNQSHLRIFIDHCKDLPVANKNDDCTNAYIKAYLLPDRSSSGKRKTTIRYNTTNPSFKETISYHTDKASLSDRTLNISVWHYQSAHNRTFLGEAKVRMSEVNFQSPQNMCLHLHAREEVPNLLSLISYNGELLVGLRYASSNKNKSGNNSSESDCGILIISIKNGRNIGNSKDYPSPFVKCSVKYRDTRLSVHKTRIVSQTSNPIWDEEFTHENIERNHLNEVEIELFVMSKRKFKKDHFLGKILLRSKCIETGHEDCHERDVLLWKRFIESRDGQMIEDYIPLRTLMD